MSSSVNIDKTRKSKRLYSIAEEMVMTITKRVVAHHKKGHYSRRSSKNDAIFFARPRQETVLPCGCIRPILPARNELMLLVISKTRPEMVWSDKDGGWVHRIPRSLRRRFGLCLKHIPRAALSEMKVVF